MLAKTTLETAIDFVMDLKAREATPATAIPSPEARNLTTLPSTQWVSDERIRE